MKKDVLFTVVLLASVMAARAGQDVDGWNLKARQKFAEQRFGIFVHWGIYANYGQGEWYLEVGHPDESVYARMRDGFYPSKFDAREWIRCFRDAGAKYMTFTSRHHDGFSLWPTAADDGYNMANTPFKRDVLGELEAACRDEGLQFNLYYSLMDWHRKDYPTGSCKGARKSIPDKREDYASYKSFMKAQLLELCERYHPGYFWLDGEWDHLGRGADGEHLPGGFDWGFDELYDLIHAHHVLVANNNHMAMRAKEDIQLFERDLPGENASGFSKGQPVAVDRPIEQCETLTPGYWGFRAVPDGFRSSEEVVAMLARAAAKNTNLLLNVGPDGSGRLPARAVEVLKGVGEWMRNNGDSIYGTAAGGVAFGKDVVSTRKGNVLYLHFLNPMVDKVAFALDGEIAGVRVLDGKGTAKAERTPSGDVVVSVSRENGYGFDVVAVLDVR